MKKKAVKSFHCIHVQFSIDISVPTRGKNMAKVLNLEKIALEIASELYCMIGETG